MKIRIQTVLFRNAVAQIDRFVEGVAGTIAEAMRHGIEVTDLVIGDCSPCPVLSAADEDWIARHLTGGVRVDVRFFDANLGSGGGHNRLASECDEFVDSLLVINPDTYAAPQMLTALSTALASGAAVAEARQIPLEHPKDYDPATGETSWASGACMLVRRDVFASVRGFDDRFFPMYCDDVDLSWRIRLTGRRVVYVPGAVVVYDKRLTGVGAVGASEAEQYIGAIARLRLATRYGRPDVVDAALRAYSSDECEPLRRAAADFTEQRTTGDVPDEIEGASVVAEFEGDGFARHRF